MKGIRFRVLGPVEIDVGGAARRPGGRNARAVLTALLLEVNHAVPVDRLVWVLWGDDPPQTAVHTVRAIVSRLRAAIGCERIEAVDHSYVLHAEPAEIDAVVFERLIRSAASNLPGDPEGVAATIAEALGLWRGEPFGDLADAEFARWETMRLDELRSRATEIAYEAEIAAGRAADVLPRLEVEAAAAPYREHLWALLMQALASQSRRVEALEVYREACTLLAGAGVEAGPELRALAECIAAGESPSGSRQSPRISG